ncbi:MAG: tetratricopeptide repeat protein [Pontiella sp.]
MYFSQKIVRLPLLGLLLFGSMVHAQSGANDLGGAPVGASTQVSNQEIQEQAKDEDVYWVEDEGRTSLRSAFEIKKDTSAEQWEFAKTTRDRNRLKKAEKRMLYLYRRWPNSKEAPWAARARADLLFERTKWKESFTAYQYLIDNYSSRMGDYDLVLERQFEIAEKIMNHRRLRWVFGGYSAQEYAVEYFEKVINNGPQWFRAPEAQFMVGKCNQNAKEFELAISAFGVLGYRYPDSAYAEDAAWQQIQCLMKLREEFMSSPEILDRTLTATTVFLSTFPQSSHRDEIIQLRNILYEVKAGRVFDEAVFYAEVPKEPEAAIIYYKKMIEEYPRSQIVPLAEERIVELRKLLAMPLEARSPKARRSRPLPFTQGSEHADG